MGRKSQIRLPTVCLPTPRTRHQDVHAGRTRPFLRTQRSSLNLSIGQKGPCIQGVRHPIGSSWHRNRPSALVGGIFPPKQGSLPFSVQPNGFPLRSQCQDGCPPFPPICLSTHPNSAVQLRWKGGTKRIPGGVRPKFQQLRSVYANRRFGQFKRFVLLISRAGTGQLHARQGSVHPVPSPRIAAPFQTSGKLKRTGLRQGVGRDPKPTGPGQQFGNLSPRLKFHRQCVCPAAVSLGIEGEARGI